MKARKTSRFVAATFLFAALVISMAYAQQAAGPVKVVPLTGLAGVKNNANGTISVEKADLHFADAKGNSNVSATSITVHCQSTRADGTLLLERDVNSKARYRGENLKATSDFAKKDANVAHENNPSTNTE